MSFGLHFCKNIRVFIPRIFSKKVVSQEEGLCSIDAFAYPRTRSF